MPEISTHGRVIRLGYSMNVHPCETLAELDKALVEGPAEIRKRLFPRQPTCAGLRFSAASADELAASPERLSQLHATLVRLGLVAYTANIFPAGNFNAGKVKEEVFRPSWRERARVSYTIAAAHAMSKLGGGASVTLSTIAGGYRKDGDDRRARDEMARNLGQTAGLLHHLKLETGVSVRLCLEPEPLTTCETVADTVEFFRAHVYPGGERALHGTATYNPSQATDILHEHLGLCFDACHHAVLWEDPVDAIDRIERSGIAIGKVQMSCALEGPAAELMRYDEPRYLHQCGTQSGKRCSDLGEAKDWTDETRTHFHVPIFLEDLGGMRTTKPFLKAAVKEILKRQLCGDFEIETYTWDVIPEATRKKFCGSALIDSLEREYAAAMDMLGCGDGQR